MNAESGKSLESFRKQAVDLVLRAPASKGQIIKKLARKTDDRALAEETADWLEGLGLIDNAGYAREVVRRCSAKGYGVIKAKAELYRREVPRRLWDEALKLMPDPALAIDTFLRGRLAAGERDPRMIKKAADALVRRGFCWEDIREGIARFSGEPGDSPESNRRNAK